MTEIHPALMPDALAAVARGARGIGPGQGGMRRSVVLVVQAAAR